MALVLANLVDRSFEREAKPFDTIHIHGFKNFATTDVGSWTPGTTSASYADPGTQTRVNLAIDQHAYVAFQVEREIELMSSLPLFQNLVRRAAYAVARKIDSDIAALLDNHTTSVGTLGVSITEADIISAVKTLNGNNVPDGERRLVVSNEQQAELWKQERFINALYRQSGGGVGDVPNEGQFGELFGVPVYRSNNLVSSTGGHNNVMFHRESDALVIYDQTAKEAYDIDTDSTKYVVHVIYGYVQVRDDHGVVVKGL